VAWFYGHSHDRRKTLINIQCLINAAGYPKEFYGIERDVVYKMNDIQQNINNLDKDLDKDLDEDCELI
jgi:hypothetical protein